MGSADVNKIKRTRQILACAVAALTGVLGSLTASMVVAARTGNGFMLSVIVATMTAVLLAEGAFIGKLISLGKTARPL